MMDLVLVVLGLLMGGALGALGGGGSILAVPMLVYIAGESVKVGTTASLVAVGAAALAGAIGHFFAGRVKVGKGVLFGVVGVGGSLLGSALNRVANPNLLLLLFALFMIFVGARMVVAGSGGPRRAQALSVGGTDVALAAEGRSTSAKALRVVIAGTVVGFLTGFFGVGGGFVIVPALVLALDFSMPDAIGTSLLVISVNSVISLGARMGHVHVPWSVVMVFSAGALVGSLVGSRAASHFQATALKRAFVVLIFALAVYMGTDAIIRMLH
ncbi:MAG: sulfite exporter TauE/SafE family protein [Actinobacteria bacterium]|nr:sulfite exporter TauE/SafE family protein [Actinomycetota bacterium]MDA8372690.1 sulfite exporter TauE/SafE family protein [Actinomycetota bacterium]